MVDSFSQQIQKQLSYVDQDFVLVLLCVKILPRSPLQEYLQSISEKQNKNTG